MSEHAKSESKQAMEHHIWIEHVAPAVDHGKHPVKAVVGESVNVEADIFRDGHARLRAVIRWRRARDGGWRESPLTLVDNDRWAGSFPLGRNARYVFTILAWTDAYASWLEDLKKRVDAGQAVNSEVLEGCALLKHIRAQVHDADYPGADDSAVLERAIATLRRQAADGEAALATAAAENLLGLVERYDPREDAVQHETLFEVIADRPLARYGAWYEMFPRSYGAVPGRHATFREAALRLPAIRDMGFDVVYLPPIHPVGTTARKGRNNALVCEPGDPGSPWAIGNADGGHMAVEPKLGTIEDFDHFVHTADTLGMEIALDFAIQASPDHPWVAEHPDWFNHRPDGTIKYAENPPKKYQDIFPINFDTPKWRALWEELRRTVLFWIEHGVRVFRVDNPHTKPLPFWHWLITSVQEKHPDVIFLAEAFTRPKMMRALAKLGFTQSYTYFTWRNHKQEMAEYLTELTQTEMALYYRPNFFANTPDILHEVLQTGGPPAFKMRLVLAATLSPAYGIYSGFELCENEAVPRSEEYLNSEKYEIKIRDWDQPGNIKEYVARVNAIRAENPALHEFTNLEFLPADNDHILFYAKRGAGGSNVLLVAVNMDPHQAHDCTVTVPPGLAEPDADGTYEVHDLLTGARYRWGEHNYVRLDPVIEPAHILRVERRLP